LLEVIHDNTLDFSAKFREIVEFDVNKARLVRKARVEHDLIEFTVPSNILQSFYRLTMLTTHHYQMDTYPFQSLFQDMIGVSDIHLSQLHRKFCQDQGHIGNRNEKLQLLEGITISSRRKTFHKLYAKFIANVIAQIISASVPMCRVFYLDLTDYSDRRFAAGHLFRISQFINSSLTIFKPSPVCE